MNVFGSDFLWGTATAGHQVEGSNSNSDTWFAELVEGTVFHEPSAMACDSLHRWKDDIDLVKTMGLNSYRFSIEWARVQPSPGVFFGDELARYEQMIDYCLELNIEPIVTLNHFTNPLWFAIQGGWMNPQSDQIFAKYVEYVITRIGSKLKRVLTLNEPNLPHLLLWLNLPDFVRAAERRTIEACRAKTGSPAFRMANVVLEEEMTPTEDGLERAHIAARNVIKQLSPHLQVGLSIAIMDDRVGGDGDPSVRDKKRAEVYERWLKLAQSDDFLGVQNYETVSYDSKGKVPLADDVPKNGMGTAIDPSSLAGAVRYAYEKAGVPILVTEHGIATEDDTQRAAFIAPSVAELGKCISDGIPVIGYMHWTLLDNFEWLFGYTMHYGLHEVDRATFERIPKASAKAYSRVVAENS